jgi:hypothetical protein
MEVQTHHQIIAVGNDEMWLLGENGETLVTATRSSGTWTISAANVDDATADDRAAATQKMTDHALLSLKGTLETTGFSTLVPHSVLGLP